MVLKGATHMFDGINEREFEFFWAKGSNLVQNVVS